MLTWKSQEKQFGTLTISLQKQDVSSTLLGKVQLCQKKINNIRLLPTQIAFVGDTIPLPILHVHAKL